MKEVEYASTASVVTWTPTPTNYEQVRSLLEQHGFRHCVPNPRTDVSALEGGLKGALKGRDRMVKARRKPQLNGVELVQVDRGVVNTYQRVAGARVVEDEVYLDGEHLPDSDLTKAFLASKAKLTSNAVSKALVGVIRSLYGYPLRDGGAVYIVPAEGSETLTAIGDGLAAIDPGNQIVVGRLVMDARTVSQAKERLEKEIIGKAAALIEEIGKGTLHQDGIERRSHEATELLASVDIYEQVLNESLEGLKNAAKLAKQAAVAASYQRMGSLSVVG